MKRLYFVSLYSFSDNVYLRTLITVRDTQCITDAENEVLKAHGNTWRLSSSMFICDTPNDVYQEL